YFDTTLMNVVPAHKRDVAMVFQSYALYPHKSVYENIAFGLRMRRFAGEEIERRVRAAARALEIEALLERRPHQLSGRQRQRGRHALRARRAFARARAAARRSGGPAGEARHTRRGRRYEAHEPDAERARFFGPAGGLGHVPWRRRGRLDALLPPRARAARVPGRE